MTHHKGLHQTNAFVTFYARYKPQKIILVSSSIMKPLAVDRVRFKMVKESDRVFAVGETIELRDRIVTDVEVFLRWMSNGEWRDFDAPWSSQLTLQEEDRDVLKENFLASCEITPDATRTKAMIITKSGELVGWVSRYGSKRFPRTCCVGIDICEDSCLNKGMGTEALTLWVDYLFKHADFHRLVIETWSFNKRMCMVAEKLAFTFEGSERELIHWQGEWHNRLRYSLLRSEWEVQLANSIDD